MRARRITDSIDIMADDAGRLNKIFAETAFLYGGNADYIESLYGRWAENPGSVSAEWRAFFESLSESAAEVKASVETTPWSRPRMPERSEQLAVFDGLWPAAEAKAAAGVKAALIESKETPAATIKVVTEGGVVYLMGLVTQRESQSAVRIASRARGVQKVVAVFEIISDEEVSRITRR